MTGLRERNEHESSYTSSNDATLKQSSETSLHASVSAVLPSPKAVLSDRCNLKKRQSNPETSASQRQEIDDILRQVTRGLQDLKEQRMCSPGEDDSARPPIPELHLSPTTEFNDQQSSRHFTKLRPTGHKLTNEPSEAQQCPLNPSTANPDYNNYNATFPIQSGFNSMTPLASRVPSQISSASAIIPLLNSSPACLANQTSHLGPSCHSKSSFVSKAQTVQSSQGSVAPLPSSDSPRLARITRSEPKNKLEKVPKCILNGKKWIVEYYNNVKDLVVDVTGLRESVYIYDCNDCIIRINGKTSAITIDDCKGTRVILDGTISATEIVNCQSIQAQREYPISEQFCGQWNGDHLVTDLSDPRRQG